MSAVTRSPVDYGRVLVLMGGRAAEREISLRSGAAVLRALLERGIDARAVDWDGGDPAGLLAAGCDRVFIALHGRGGEDGTLQGALELLGMPYTGSGVLASALAMDKLRTKQMWRGCGLPTPDHRVVEHAGQADAVIAALGLPLMMKPAREGSSIGVSMVRAADEFAAAFAEARRHDEVVIAERHVRGGEYTAPVLAGQVLPLVKLETPRDFYDYEAKYLADTTRYLCPCGLDAAAEATLAATARAAFEALGAEGWGRIDFMLDAEGRPWLIEANTVPGMTDHSLLPLAAGVAGIDFGDLVLRILDSSFLRRGQGR